jgi:pyruvate formate lyase activating enzyme
VTNAASAVAVDPIEKKPLYHFLPGSKILSIGTVGCTLQCRFCQNWAISQQWPPDQLTALTPHNAAAAARAAGCPSVAFTYNEPAVFAEFALETAAACRAEGVAAVAVSAGYFQPRAALEFFGEMDAANIDLKAFTDGFYQRLCGGHLAPVLETLERIHHQTSCWLEITTLLIPGENDGDDEVRNLCRWVFQNLGPEVPVHFSAFHPDHRMRNKPVTPAQTVQRARNIGLSEGLRFVYSGNVTDSEGSLTRCPQCHGALVAREAFQVTLARWGDTPGRCPDCGGPVAGRWI